MSNFHDMNYEGCIMYLKNLEKLVTLNKFATYYPNIAIHIVVTIRAADPNSDYSYDMKNFKNHALVVTLSWKPGALAHFFCYSTYPKNKVCTLASVPTLFPSGNHSEMLGCSPSCHMIKRTKYLRKNFNYDDEQLYFHQRKKDKVELKYLKNTKIHAELDLKLNKTYKQYDETIINKEVLNDLPHDTLYSSVDENDKSIAPDVGLIEWNYDTNSAELHNSSLLQFFLEPSRRAESESCRLTNFTLGGDIYKKNKSETDKSKSYHMKQSVEYCDAFQKKLDTSSGSCITPFWYTLATYTIAGDGILHLIKEASSGFKNCQRNFEADENLRENGIPSYTKTKNEVIKKNINLEKWREIDKYEIEKWILPPNNILLSDLKLDFQTFGTLQYWDNLGGLSMRMPLLMHVKDVKYHKILKDNFNVKKIIENSEYDFMENVIKNKFFEKWNRIDSEEEDKKKINNDESKTVKRDITSELYEYLEKLSNEYQLPAVVEAIAQLGTSIAFEKLVKYLFKKLKLGLKNTVIPLLKRTAGKMSGKLLLGIVRSTFMRVTVKILTSSKMAMILSVSATGVGVIWAIFQLTTFLLDVIILFGIDLGNYNNEFSLEYFESISENWMNSKDHLDLDNTLNKPENLIGQLVSEINDVNKSDDMSKEPIYYKTQWWNKDFENLFEVKNSEDINNIYDNSTIAQRLPPLYKDEDFILVAQMTYLSSLRKNFYGQLIDLKSDIYTFKDEDVEKLQERINYNKILTQNILSQNTFKYDNLKNRMLIGSLISISGLVLTISLDFLLNTPLITLSIFIAFMFISLVVFFYPLDVDFLQINWDKRKKINDKKTSIYDLDNLIEKIKELSQVFNEETKSGVK